MDMTPFKAAAQPSWRRGTKVALVDVAVMQAWKHAGMPDRSRAATILGIPSKRSPNLLACEDYAAVCTWIAAQKTRGCGGAVHTTLRDLAADIAGCLDGETMTDAELKYIDADLSC